MTGATASSAALCSVTVHPTVWQEDLVLRTVLQQASPSQCHVKQHKSCHTGIQLTFHHVVLTQRNAILRGLATTILHGALAPLLTGGLAVAAHHQLTYWMSVADQVRRSSSSSSSTADNDTLLLFAELSEHLTQHAFLVPATATPTLADWDLAVALSSNTMNHYHNDMDVAVQRWYRTTLASLQAASKQDFPLIVPPAPPMGPPVFFYGSENAASVLEQPQLPSTSKQHQKQSNPSNEKTKTPPVQQVRDHQMKKTKQDQQHKQSKQQQQQQQQAPATFDVSALDIRVGLIRKAWTHQTADKLYCQDIDLGPAMGTRQIASGLRPYYHSSADLEGQKVLVLCNLKKRHLQGFASHGMVLCASCNNNNNNNNADHRDVQLVTPPATAQVGSRVQFGTELLYTGEPAPESKMAKKKIFEQVAPDLQTNAAGQLVYKKTAVATVQGQVIQAGMANAQVA